MIIIAEVSFAQMAKFLFHLLFILIYHCRYLHIEAHNNSFHYYSHCLKSVHIRSLSRSFIFNRNAGKYGPERLRTWTLFTQ